MPGKQRICVAVITFKRPLMLKALLESFSALRIPADMELCFLIVDNDPQGSAYWLAAEFEARIKLRYVVEPETGIPFARNRALREAHALGAGFLAFIDDDETADPDWLVELAASANARRLELVGGPVRCGDWAGNEPPTRWQRLVFEGIRSRYTAKEKSASHRFRLGKEGETVVVTNNWLLDLEWQKRTGLRFDESLRETGGSDALFYREAKRLGIRSGWSVSAIVRERVPLSRATFAYQFGRARHQSMASFQRNHPSLTAGAAALAITSSIVKIIICVLAVLALPFAGGRALILVARQGGWVAGRFQALAGRRSSLYSVPDGV